MNLTSKHKVEATFSMSSMTDVIFLLLIFFMLTASFITPSGLPVHLPTSQSSTIVMQQVSISITADLAYYINDQRVPLSQLGSRLKAALRGKEGVVALHCDKSVPVEYMVKVAGIATSLRAKISLVAQPD